MVEVIKLPNSIRVKRTLKYRNEERRVLHCDPTSPYLGLVVPSSIN